MSYKVVIRDNKTGEVRICHQDLEWLENSDFWWTEGNMACDCNRHLEFVRAKGEPEEEGFPCGDTRYSALYAEPEDGTKVTLDNA